MHIAPGHHCSLPFKKIGNHICEHQKILKKNMDVVNDISQQRVNFQFKILYILASTKITNLIKLRDLKYVYLDPHFCYFCVAQNTTYLNLIVYTFVGYINNYPLNF